MKHFALLACLAVISGCAARSQVIKRDVTEEHPARSGPVCLIRAPLPDSIKYTALGQIKSSKRTYGTVSELLPLMAEDARALGADAIIKLQTGQKMGAWAWARPVGTGVAVKIADPSTFNCQANGGELR